MANRLLSVWRELLDVFVELQGHDLRTRLEYFGESSAVLKNDGRLAHAVDFVSDLV